MVSIQRRNVSIFLLTTLVLLYLGDGVFGFLDTRIRDIWVRWRVAANQPDVHPWLAKTASLFPLDKHSGDILLVLYDDRAYLSIPGPPPPWNRRVFADAIRTIGMGHHKVLGIDLFFRAPSAFDIQQDADLISAVKQASPTVLMAYRKGNFVALPFPALSEVAISAPPYFYPYLDESIRKSSLVYRTMDVPPRLSFVGEMARLYWGLPPEKVEILDREVIFHLPGGDRRIPLDEGENLFINYNSMLRTIPVISMFDLFHKKIDPVAFKDKVVILGLSNSLIQDRFMTPTGMPEFGSLIHAVTLQNILTGTFLQNSGIWQGFLLGVILLLTSTLLLSHILQPLPYLATTTGGCLVLVAFSWYSLIFSLQMTNVAPGLFGLIASCVFSVGARYYNELSEKLRIKNAFQHYVTTSVVNEMLKDPGKLVLHGEERIITIFFSDIAGFTTLSEGMAPIKVVNLLNEYLTLMTEGIFKFEGLLDKYEGDGIMAVFGAPIGQSDHAIRACRCAIDNQKSLSMLREKWSREGNPEIKARIGINTGIVVVGNMGSKMRFDYTVIGDNVNLASRLESANKIFKSDILIGEATNELVKDKILTRFVGSLLPVGRLKTVRTFEILCALDEPDQQMLSNFRNAKEIYETAFQLAIDGKPAEGLALLDSFQPGKSADKPLQILHEELTRLAAQPQKEHWDGVWKQRK